MLRREPAGAALFLGDVADLMCCAQMAFEALDQVVGEAEKMRLHGLRDGGAGPSAFGLQLRFESIEEFLKSKGPGEVLRVRS